MLERVGLWILGRDKLPLCRGDGGSHNAGMAKTKPLRTIHLLSDSTGNLAGHMLRAFLTQFPADTFQVKRHHFLKTPAKLQSAMEDVCRQPGIILHALVDPQAKKTVESVARKQKLPACDLTGSFVDFLASASGVKPTPDVKRLHEVSREYESRIGALEFTLEHDDGLGLDTLHQADIVLTGVSRTSKTPTCIYLGQLGYRCANVALAIEVPPPAELLALPGTKVVGLLINPLRLSEIRKTRLRTWSMSDTGYNEADHVDKEIAWSKRLFAKQGWPTLDVTSTAIEETAARVVEMLKLPIKTP
jgi:[pyruvate, water dikinase]-phosphate phosphotransferase / [pyruvate, water dikinase] kinase